MVDAIDGEIQDPASQKVEIAVTDMAGRKVIVAQNYQLNEGLNSIPIETSKWGLGAGVYVIHVNSDGSNRALRMVVSE